MIKSLSVYRPAPYVTRRLRCRLLCDNAWSADDTPRVRMDACSQCLAREFRSENAGLGYENPPVFVTSQVGNYFPDHDSLISSFEQNSETM